MNRNATAVILIALAIGIYMTFTRAKLVEVNEVRAVNAQYLLAIQNADELTKVRDTVLKQYNALSETNRERLDKMLPNTVDNIRLIIDMNDIADQHGFTLRNIRAAASSGGKASSVPPPQGGAATNVSIPTPTLDTVVVSFSVTAPYQRFMDLLHALEANLRIMDVTHLSLTASKTPGVYDFTVELKTYWLRSQ